MAWEIVKDGNAEAREIFDRHYSRKSYADGRKPKLFVGPGQKMVMLHRAGERKALFVWRYFISGDGQQGVNCVVFRNEGAGLSSELLWDAMMLAWRRWPGYRFYTYVNAKKVASRNPGYCFKVMGWKRCGVTKWNKLDILEFEPGVFG